MRERNYFAFFKVTTKFILHIDTAHFIAHARKDSRQAHWGAVRMTELLEKKRGSALQAVDSQRRSQVAVFPPNDSL